MNYTPSLEYVVTGSYKDAYYSKINYFSKNDDDRYGFSEQIFRSHQPRYKAVHQESQYSSNPKYNMPAYAASHSFTPNIFLNPSRPKSRIVVDNSDARKIAEEIFELMMDEKMPEGFSINVLPLAEFRSAHSRFGLWNNGILGFSINGNKKEIFVREMNLDEMMLVLGHEIGHVLTKTLPNKHDEEAKAFAFSIKWAETIKKHNVANLGMSIKDELDMNPARNGLHDVAFSFVSLMLKKGRTAIEVHQDLAKKYISMFNGNYV